MEKDVSRLAVERVVATVGRVRQVMATKMPYGPSKVKMSKREARRFLQNMEPAMQETLKKKMGTAEWDALMKELYNAR